MSKPSKEILVEGCKVMFHTDMDGPVRTVNGAVVVDAPSPEAKMRAEQILATLVGKTVADAEAALVGQAPVYNAVPVFASHLDQERAGKITMCGERLRVKFAAGVLESRFRMVFGNCTAVLTKVRETEEGRYVLEAGILGWTLFP